MKKVLVLVFSDLNYDARVSRQVNWLKEKYEVTVASFGVKNEDEQFIKLEPQPLKLIRKAVIAFLLLSRFYRSAYYLLYPYKHLYKKLKERPDIIVANDLETLPLAIQMASKFSPRCKVYFDAHEYSPRQFEDKLWFKLFFQKFNYHLCRKYLSGIDGMSTVSPGLASEYNREFGVSPTLILNAPEYHHVELKETSLPVRLIHHGGATISRKIENMIKMMDYLGDNYQLDLMLVVPPRASAATKEYYNRLKDLSKNNAAVNFIDPVKQDEVIDTIKNYDIGIYILEPINFNHKHAVPNKLLDFIQARLAVAISPSPDMKKIIEMYDCGVVAKDFEPESLAKVIKELTIERLAELKTNSDKAAKELNADKFKSTFLKDLDQLIS